MAKLLPDPTAPSPDELYACNAWLEVVANTSDDASARASARLAQLALGHTQWLTRKGTSDANEAARVHTALAIMEGANDAAAKGFKTVLRQSFSQPEPGQVLTVLGFLRWTEAKVLAVQRITPAAIVWHSFALLSPTSGACPSCDATVPLKATACPACGLRPEGEWRQTHPFQDLEVAATVMKEVIEAAGGRADKLENQTVQQTIRCWRKLPGRPPKKDERALPSKGEATRRLLVECHLAQRATTKEALVKEYERTKKRIMSGA